ncbi:MAG: RHS repeat-associated core domain-containing protein, partial [Verrucomicrobia bacterium]|nr:RHS repeat-associated core domain-containing protein [Verrucomicrobiota bacterium]
EIGVAVNGAKAWKVYGPDLDGVFGSLQGTGGLEAAITDADRSTSGVIGDQFGNGVAAVTGGNLSWFATRVGSYGPLPGSEVQTLTEVSKLAESTAWRGRRVDATGFIFLGARYYEPNGGRFLSADPMGHGASMSLYDYCNGDPVNSFDPDGRYGKDLNKNPYPHRVAQSPWLQDVIDWLFGPGSSLPEKLMVTPFGDVVRSLDQTSKSFADKDYIIAILRSLETAGDVASSLGARGPKSGPTPAAESKVLQGPPTATTRVSNRPGNQPSVELNHPDGRRVDINADRVKEWVPATDPRAPAGTMQKVPFENAQPGSKGFKRDPTPAELDILKNRPPG